MSKSAEERSRADRIAWWSFVIGILLVIWFSGIVVGKKELFPYPQMKSVYDEAKQGFAKLRGELQPGFWFFYRAAPEGVQAGARTLLPEAVSDELAMVYGLGDDDLMSIRILDNSGEVLHRWDVSAFELWPEMSHVPEDLRPKDEPSGELHGLEFLPDGDVVFNLEPLGLMRLGFCGDVKWRLPMFTHHAVHLDESGLLYVLQYPYLTEEGGGNDGRIIEESILKVSLDGEILKKIPLLDILRKAEIDGLLYLSSIGTYGIEINEADVLHANDVETFPSNMEPGVFERGDIMVSLRNLNAVIVFEEDTGEIKYVLNGPVFMQHDPDFINGNEISVFDNHSVVSSYMHRDARPKDTSSRIVIADARDDASRVFFEGTDEVPFFTDIMGKHQWLSNGNLMLTEARWGRAIEITPDGKLAWEFNNVIQNGKAKGMLGMIAEARRLPAEFDKAKLEALKASCPGNG